MTTTPTPRTKAGKRLLANCEMYDICRELILAIEAEARADVDGLRDHVAALQSELRDLLAERREARMEVEVASRADVDGLVARLRTAVNDQDIGEGYVITQEDRGWQQAIRHVLSLIDALLAGDKAEAPPENFGEQFVSDIKARKAEAPE